jgi:hypothetical protein
MMLWHTKNYIFLKSYALFATAHLNGEKNGRKNGIMLSIAVRSVGAIKAKGINQTPTFQFPPRFLFSIGLFFREAYFFAYFVLQVPALFHLYYLSQTR